MKKILLFAAVLCGMTSFAVDPVAVWNGDFSTTTKGDYALSANGNTVATDGSTITISQAKGVTFARSSALGNTVGMTVIYKFDNLVVGSTIKTIGTASAGGGNADRVGVNVQTSGQTSGIWANTTTYNDGANQTTISTVDTDGQFALVYGPSVSNNTGTFLYLKNRSADYTLVYSCGGLKGGNDTVQAMTVGGTRNNGGTFPAASGMVIKAVALFDQALTKDQIAAYEFPEVAKKNESVLLLNFGKSNPTGWVTCNEMNVGGNIPQTGTLSQEGSSATFRIEGNGNFFNEDNNDFDLVTNGTFSNGTYRGADGKDYETIEAEVKASLGLVDNVVFDSSVYGCGLQNGGYADHTATIGGLDVTAKYIVYVGYGMHKSNQCAGFKITSDQCSSVDSIDYVTTVAGTGTSVVNSYTAANVGAELRPGENGLLIVRLTNVVPTSSGEIKFAPHGERSGINFLAVAKVNESRPTSKTFEIAGEVSYDNLATEGLTSVTLNLTADATVTFTKAVSANLTFTGAYNLTVKGGQHLTWANITDSEVTGTRTYEISGSYTAADGLKNKIKADTTKATYVFKGTDNNGATLDFGNRAITSAIASHLVFEGGTGHSLTIGVNNGNTQLASGNTADTPFILVKGGTTLTVATNWMTGYSLAFSSNSCIVRVNDGGTLKFNQGTTRVWYNGQLYLDPGATIDLSACGATSPDALGFNGGVLDAKQQIYVPATADGAEIGVVKITGRSLGLASDGTAGCGIFVGKNSRLEIEGFSNDSDKPAVSKYGEGELRISGNVAICNNTSKNFTIKAGLVTFNGTVSNSPVSVESGASLSGSGTISSALTLQAGSSIVVDSENRLTASSSLTLANPINLICTPVHGMTVITPPSGFAGTGYKATLNGSEQQYDLYLEDGALKLKYKTPPAFPEGFGDFVIEVASGKVGEISVDVSKLSLNDYEKDSGVSYKLDFGGDKIVVGARTDNIVTFNLATGDFFIEHVYRGDFVVEFPDGEVKKPITVYEGVRTPTWISSELIIRKQGTINDAQGETIKLEEEETILNHDPDYIDNCDSVYTVTLSASEAVEAGADDALKGDEQGGLRLVKVEENTVKLEYLYNDEGDNNTVKWGDQWPDGTKTGTVTLALNTSVTVRVEFHYAKGEDGDTSYVKYSIGEDYATSVTSWATAKKVTEVFIADGTVLPDDLTGLFQLDSAVVVDIELKPGEGDVIDYNTEAEANAAIKTLKVGICDAVMSVLTTTEDQETYRKYFQLVVVPSKMLENGFSVKTEFTTEAKSEIEKELEAALSEVVNAFNSGSAEIVGKPGLYYGVKRGETLEAMSVKEDLQMADADGKVTISITKPDTSKSHFYRIIVSPTPATK